MHLRSLISLACLLSISVATDALAAKLFLANGVDGGETLTMAPFGVGTLDLRLTTYSVDTIQVSFINAFLNTTSNEVDVSAVAGGQDWTYDRTAFKLPAEISLAGGNEYGLVSGSSDGSHAIPLGSGTWVIDSLSLYSTTDESKTINVTFELSYRTPQVFGPPPSYHPFTVMDPSFPSGFPNVLYLGTGWDPFYIYLVPEPGLFVLMATAALLFAARGASRFRSPNCRAYPRPFPDAASCLSLPAGL